MRIVCFLRLGKTALQILVKDFVEFVGSSQRLVALGLLVGESL